MNTVSAVMSGMMLAFCLVNCFLAMNENKKNWSALGGWFCCGLYVIMNLIK